MHDVAVLHDVVFAFKAHFASFFGRNFAAKRGIVVVGDGFSPDEAFFKVGVDDASGLRRGCPAPRIIPRSSLVSPDWN